MTREPIYAALFALLAGSAAFATTGRKLKHWSDVAPPEQPALYQAQTGESCDPRGTQGAPPRWTFSVDVYVYANSAGGDLDPAAILNPLLDAVCTALGPENAMTGRQTLGGLVEHCWIEGAIKTDEGVLGEQCVAIIPVRILTT